MPTLHWFYSLGTQATKARYVMTAEFRNRVASYFPDSAAPWTPVPVAVGRGKWTPGNPTEARIAESATPALLDLLRAPKGWTLRAHLFPTQEILQSPSGGPSPHDVVVEEAPEWAKAALRVGVHDQLVDVRAETVLERVISVVLSADVANEDVVFFESTNGLRPFVTGFLLADGVLRALRPGIRIVAVSYGELGAGTAHTNGLPNLGFLGTHPKHGDPEGEYRLTPLYDQTLLMRMPQWASAIDDLARRFDGGALATMVASAQMSGALGAVAANLDLGWPDDLVGPLLTLQRAVATGEVAEPAEAASVALLTTQFRDLTDIAVRLKPGVLNFDRLRMHLSVAQALQRGGRFGDCVRVLRELMVDAMVLAVHGDTSGEVPDAVWMGDARGKAELAWFRAGKLRSELWLTVGKHRNAASHARSSVKHRIEGGTSAIAAFLKEGGIDQVEEALFEEGTLRADLAPSGAPSGPLIHYFHGKDARPSDPTRRAVEAELELEAQDAAYTELTVVLGRAGEPSGRHRGVKDLREKARKAEGRPHAVLILPNAPAALAALARALVEQGTRPWAWIVNPLGGPKLGELQPLFGIDDF